MFGSSTGMTVLAAALDCEVSGCRCWRRGWGLNVVIVMGVERQESASQREGLQLITHAPCFEARHICCAGGHRHCFGICLGALRSIKEATACLQC